MQLLCGNHGLLFYLHYTWRETHHENRYSNYLQIQTWLRFVHCSLLILLFKCFDYWILLFFSVWCAIEMVSRAKFSLRSDWFKWSGRNWCNSNGWFEFSVWFFFWLFFLKKRRLFKRIQKNRRGRNVQKNQIFDFVAKVVSNSDFCASRCGTIRLCVIFYADRMDSYRGLTNTHYTLSIQNSTVPSSIAKLNNVPTLFQISARHQYKCIQ